MNENGKEESGEAIGMGRTLTLFLSVHRHVIKILYKSVLHSLWGKQ